MNSRLIQKCLFLLYLYPASQGIAQTNQIRVPIFVFDTVAPSDTITLMFGWDSLATYGIDTQLGEIVYPPDELPNFDARMAGRLLGTGTYLDLHPTQYGCSRDTFTISFGNWLPEAVYASFGIIWDPQLLPNAPDSIAIRIPAGTDLESGNTISSRVINMREQDSVLIPSAMFWGIESVKILDVRCPNNVNEIDPPAPEKFILSGNYPNPFNPSTNIAFSIPVASRVSLTVSNVLGQVVGIIASGTYQPGSYSSTWDASGFNSGVYFCRFEATGISDSRKSFVQTSKFMLLK
jgi:hypothetical protein